MNRLRAISLGVMTVGLALGTGALVQRMAPEDHPARGHPGQATPMSAAGSDNLPDIPAEAIVPLAADSGLPDGAAPVAFGDDRGGGLQLARAPAALSGAMPELAGALAETGRRAAEALPRLIEMVPPERLAELAAADPPPGTLPAAAAPAVDCAPQLTLVAVPGAMIDLAFDAPCDPDARVVVSHAGLAVTARTSGHGALDLSLPAMAILAEVSLRIDGGPAIADTVEVPDLDLYDRVAVQWQRDDAFQLHAYEFGADHDAPGHVSAANPAGPERALGGTGGFLTLLGDSTTDWPLLAEVYSFPAGRIAGVGAVEVTLEAAITPETCGREMLGEVLRVRRGGPVEVTEFHVGMPECDSIGGYVLLKNLVSELTLARN